MRRLLLIVLALMVIAFGVIEFVLAGNPVRDPAQADKVLKAAVDRVHARDALGQDAKTNGFLDLKDKLYKAPKEATAPYSALVNWTYCSTGDSQRDILTQYATRSADIQKSITAFESVLPQLQVALAKPNFIWPSEWEKGSSAMFPNLILLRGVAQSLGGYAEYCELKGQDARALHYNLLALELGNKLGQNGPLIGGMIAIALESLATTNTLEFLTRGPALKAEDYRNASKRLEALNLSPQVMLDRMDEEYAFQITFLNLLRDDPASQTSGMDESQKRFSNVVFRLPGYIEHEKRNVINLYLVQRPSVEQLHSPAEDGIDVSKKVADVSHFFSMAATLVPNSDRAIVNWRLGLTKIGALKIVCAMQWYKLEKKAWPNTLAELVPTYLSKLPPAYSSPNGTYRYEGGHLSVDLKPAEQEIVRAKVWNASPADPRHSINVSPSPSPHKN